jgi:hypothetical protein
MKAAQNMKEVRELRRAAFATLQISRSVTMFSKVGNSVVEIYVPAVRKEYVLDQLMLNNVQLVSLDKVPAGCNPAPTEQKVRRLAHLYGSARFRNLQQAVLAGETEATQALILERVATLRESRNPVALFATAHHENTDAEMPPAQEADPQLRRPEPAEHSQAKRTKLAEGQQ